MAILNIIKCLLRKDYSPSPNNPMEKLNFQIEELLDNICKVNDKFSSISLRYFNPIGAHESKLIGKI